LTFKPELSSTTNASYKGSRSLTHKWKGMNFSQNGSEPEHTGFDTSKLDKIARATVEIPDNFTVHPRLSKMYIDSKLKSLGNN
jgi:2-oxoglutarate dehydrogenase complex dehydrogenase (E1) component-like enzyme